jgi:hypothetical protein
MILEPHCCEKACEVFLTVSVFATDFLNNSSCNNRNGSIYERLQIRARFGMMKIAKLVYIVYDLSYVNAS